MARPFKLPDLGEGIHEGEVIAVLVSEGDRVAEGQPILEVETDKAAVQIPCPFSGTVQEIKVKPNDLVRVGSVMMTFGEQVEPALNGTRVGERAVPAPGGNGTHRGGRAASNSSSAGGPSTSAGGNAIAEAPSGPVHPEGPVPASPATRRQARELGVDLHLVPGSGPAGLVTAADVQAFAEREAGSPSSTPKVEASAGPSAPGVEALAGTAGAESRRRTEPPTGTVEEGHVPAKAPTPQAGAGESPATASAPATPAVPPLPDFARWGPVERTPLRSVRRTTAQHMALAWSQIPHVNHQDVADITLLEDYRRKQAARVEALGGKLSITVFVMKAVVAALKAYPRFNSSLDTVSQEIILKRYYHLGIAADTERGLVVPVIKDVDRKSIAELSVELKEMAERARAGQTALEEMQGGTFTITNIGALGGTGFAAIINYPQVAILGMGRAQLQPVVLGDRESYEIVPRLMLPLVLAFDHRVLDGADAARFVRMIRESLENPDQLWLKI